MVTIDLTHLFATCNPSTLSSMHATDLGAAFLLSPDIQIDLSGGAGLTDNAADYFINAGLSFRLAR